MSSLSTRIPALHGKRANHCSAKPWSVGEDAAVLLGRPYGVTAKYTGRTKAAVQQRAYRLRHMPQARARAMEWANG